MFVRHESDSVLWAVTSGPIHRFGMAGKLLQGQIGLITGASKGIGAAIARKFADNGATLAITGLPKEGLKEVHETELFRKTVAPLESTWSLTAVECLGSRALATICHWISLIRYTRGVLSGIQDVKDCAHCKLSCLMGESSSSRS
jgi:hypothetical protein